MPSSRLSDIITRFSITTPAIPYCMIDITDPGKDLDDEQKFVLSAALQRTGIVDIAAVVANLEPPLMRARLAKGTFNKLGLNVPVGVGSDCFKGGSNQKHETDVPYLASEMEVVMNGHQLLVDTLSSADDASITLVLNSGMTDAAELLRKEPQLFTRKVAGVTIMGGVEAKDPTTPFTRLLYRGFLVPDDAANNAFDAESAEYLYRTLQEYRVPMTIIMRSACYAAQFSIRLYDEFAATGNPVGVGLKNRQKGSIQQLWMAALSPEGSPIRGKLPMSRDRQWFVNVFCGKQDPGIGIDDEIWPFVGMYNQYDPMAVVAAIPELRDRFFTSTNVEVGGVTHRIIGLTAESTGIKDKEGLIAFMSELELAALVGE